MKNPISTIATLGCVVAQTYGQVTVGSRMETSPTVTPGTNLVYAEAGDPFTENPVDMEQVLNSERPYFAYLLQKTGLGALAMSSTTLAGISH